MKMIFADYAAIAMSIVGFLLSMQGLWLVCRALWPGRVEAAAERCRTGGLKCILLGLPVSLAVTLIAAVIGKSLGTFGQLFSFALVFLYIVYASIGVAGLATHIGQQLRSPADADRPWRATIRGGLALELAWLVPLLGWFGLLPVSLILGAGATTLSFVRARVATGYAGPLPPSTPLPVPPPLVRSPELEPAGVGR